MKFLAFSLLAALISCDTVVTPTQTVGGVAGTGTSSAPVVNPAITPAIDAITIEPQDAPGCLAGQALALGCVARVTATPRFRGVAISPAQHGPVCTWRLDGAIVAGSASTNVVYATETSNPFNLALFGQGQGTFTLEAEVLGVRSGPRLFIVR